MQKISLFDYARLSRRETPKKCQVSVGDLVRLESEQDKRKTVIGIVAVIYEDNMCILVGDKVEWWSRYTSCCVLSK